ncbi:hybrid sensor histidine kinase/response regulator [Emcibacter sp.]|uniref:ATP-binding response regulator n=1 Tax=Emcibacter sp. TaxID=1979954 RepID=UPI002AA65D93|nr:hybrid sensor histidine kinase/response regulator [Emcibacter sp.]
MIATTNDRYILVEQTKLLLKQVPVLVVLTSLVALVIAFFITKWVSPEVAAIWCVLICGTSALRYWHYALIRDAKITVDSYRGLLVLLVFFSAVSGGFWGALGIILPVTDNVLVMVLTVMLLVGMVAGSLASLSIYKYAYFAYAIPAILPLAGRCLASQDEILTMVGVLSLVFLLVNMFHSHLAQKSVIRSINLVLENQNLIQRLQFEKNNAIAAREQADRNSEAKSRFLAAASHDLRQPLNAMGFFVAALMNEANSQKVKELTVKIDQSLEALRDLFTSLLDLSKIESGVLAPNFTSFHLSELFKEITNDFATHEKIKHVNLEIDECGDAVVRSDRQMLNRILRNLVSNALRYTSEGFVRLYCEASDSHLIIHVSDSGEGIPEDKREEIFKEFYQIGNPERDRTKGLGLGLSIVDGLCRILKHRVSLVSEVGKGSTFSVLVPKGKVTEVVAHRPENDVWTDVESANILVIDDEEYSRAGMRELISQWGHGVYTFENPDEAELFLDMEGIEPNLIISDYRLRNGVTGDQAIRRLQEKIGHSVPALIVTGDTEKDRILEAKSSGFSLLHKPVQPAKLRSALSYLLTNG